MSNIRLGKIEPRSMLSLDTDIAKALEKMNKINEYKRRLPQIDCAICIVPYIERYNPNAVSGHEQLVPVHIVECESIDTVQILQEITTLLLIEGQNHLAIRFGLELILPCKGLPDGFMIVNLPVYSQYFPAIRRI